MSNTNLLSCPESCPNSNSFLLCHFIYIHFYYVILLYISLYVHYHIIFSCTQPYVVISFCATVYNRLNASPRREVLKSKSLTLTLFNASLLGANSFLLSKSLSLFHIASLLGANSVLLNRTVLVHATFTRKRSHFIPRSIFRARM